MSGPELPNIGLQPATARWIIRPSRLKPHRYADSESAPCLTS
jgi:hypothetical protein